jgi:hypothetical protein
MRSDPFLEWTLALERRHLQNLSFQEVRRALQALSSLYVHRRDRLRSGAAFEGAGKRAALALFYGPLHYAVVRHVVRELGAARRPPRCIYDLGCGTGAAGAAWAGETGRRSSVVAVDVRRWAVEETRWTLRQLGVKGHACQEDLQDIELAGGRTAILAAFTVNELDTGERGRLLERLFEAADRGSSLLILEPAARRAFPWFQDWSARFVRAGGRADLWRFAAELPPLWRSLDRAAGLDHGELVARSLFLGR